jgi:signal recognition particle subunit SRP54
MAESAKGDFTLDDFRKQLSQLKTQGAMLDIMAGMPGMGDMIPDGEEPEEALQRIQGMIDAMTKEERRNPDIIDQPRRERIARDSGTEPYEVKQFLAQFNQIRDLMRQLAQMSLWQRIKLVLGFGKLPGWNGGNKEVGSG